MTDASGDGSAYSAQTDSETESTMNEDVPGPFSGDGTGDDAFGGAVGDRLPGGMPRPTQKRTAAAYGVSSSPSADETPVSPASPAAGQPTAAPAYGSPEEEVSGDHPDTILAAERLLDLQRLQAEYVNYKKRVDRDRELQRELTIGAVVESLLPVLDEIHLARQHGELESGPFAKIAEKFEGIIGKYGVARFGEPGETFDPMVHQALMHVQAELAPGTSETTVVQVMQPGYKVNDRVVRPAMVAVADPA